jgi:cell division protein FtsQ
MRSFIEKAQNTVNEINWSFIFGVSFFMLVTFTLIKATYWVSDWLVINKDTEISKLTVLGKPNYTSDKEIIRAVKRIDLSSYFALDVQAVQQSVTALPWVASVSVRKQWPDQLQVFVVEHTPVAFWNSDLLLNQMGQVFQAQSEKLSKKLPQLFGPEGSEKEAWQVFLQLRDMLQVNNFDLVSLALSERFAWQLWLDNGVRLNLGRTDKAKRVQRFIDVYPLMEKPQGAHIDEVDLRYDTGLAISWKYQQVPEQQLKSKA